MHIWVARNARLRVVRESRCAAAARLVANGQCLCRQAPSAPPSLHSTHGAWTVVKLLMLDETLFTADNATHCTLQRSKGMHVPTRVKPGRPQCSAAILATGHQPAAPQAGRLAGWHRLLVGRDALQVVQVALGAARVGSARRSVQQLPTPVTGARLRIPACAVNIARLAAV